MRARLIVAVTLLASGFVPQGAAAAAPPGAISPNIQYIATIPDMTTAISLTFMGDTMFVSAQTGVYSYDISNPAAPKLLGALPQWIWANEDVDIDRERKLLIISREPGFLPVGGGAAPFGAVEIVDVSNPALMIPVSFTLSPGGHTATCIDHCRYLWLGGFLSGPEVRRWGGRPVHAIDIRNPASPILCPAPIDTGRDDGMDGIVHDVQEDAFGIAWVSGGGGVRGYWTSGVHTDPVTGETREADGCFPIPYAGGGTPSSATPSRFMHNAWRNPAATVDGRAGVVLWATEEWFGSCAQAGRLATYDLQGSYNGEGFKNGGAGFRLRVLDTWKPEIGQPGSDGCDSAHNFTDRGDQVIAQGFFTQGTRVLDMSNPRDIRQIGYFRPNDSSAWQAVWHGDYIFIADNNRGIDIVRFGGGATSRTVRAPLVSVRMPRLPMDPAWDYVCPVSERRLL